MYYDYDFGNYHVRYLKRKTKIQKQKEYSIDFVNLDLNGCIYVDDWDRDLVELDYCIDCRYLDVDDDDHRHYVDDLRLHIDDHLSQNKNQ